MYISQFNYLSQVWQVIVQAAPEYRSRPDDIKQVYVRSNSGGMVPLSAVTKLTYSSAPNLITRFNTFPAAKVTGGAGPGYSSGQALATMEAVAREVLPQGIPSPGAARLIRKRRSAAIRRWCSSTA